MDAEEQKQSNAIRSRWMEGAEAREKARKNASRSLKVGLAFMALIPIMAVAIPAYRILTPDPVISMMDVLPFQGFAFLIGALFMLGALTGE